MALLGKARTEQLCSQSWFLNWNHLQKSKFLDVIVRNTTSSVEEELLFGLENLGLGGVAPGVFECQLKLFCSWWENWTQEQRQGFLQQLATTDPGFGQQAASRLGVSFS